MSAPQTSSRGVAVERALVVCLCAEWCGSCREYRALFAQLASAVADQADCKWIDIEDHADVLGDLDIDDFPTLLIVHGGTPCFFGPVTPHLQTAERLVQSALAGALGPLLDPAVAALAVRARDCES